MAREWRAEVELPKVPLEVGATGKDAVIHPDVAVARRR